MATARSAERLRRPTSSGSQPRAGTGSRSSPPEDEGKKLAVSVQVERGSPPCGHPVCPLCLLHRRSGSQEQLRRRSDPEKSSGRPARRDCDTRREFFVTPALTNLSGKYKSVVSDSENEEPLSRMPKTISAFIRKTKTSSSCTGGFRQESKLYGSSGGRGQKLKVVSQPAVVDKDSISHSYAAGILLSSENSRSASLSDRRLISHVAATSTPAATQSRPECSIARRPTIIKSTPRNLTRGLQKATSYEASPAVLQKWRQIELDRQRINMNSKATLTSPISELHAKTGWAEDGSGAGTTKTRQVLSAGHDGDGVFNKRRLVFDPPDSFQKPSVKIWVPAIRYNSEVTVRGSSRSDQTVGTPELCSEAMIDRKRSFSPYPRKSGFQCCKLSCKDSISTRKDEDSGIYNQSASRRGRKRKQKTKHLDSDREVDPKRSKSANQDTCVQQLKQDRALALKLQRQFDLENQGVNRRQSPDKYFLRSWMANHNRRRRSLRRISKKL
ncbi:E3 ubiquitin-protein ligase RNF169-like [Thalassophryne amazonica]|uniref:E3 ubiquitin-protein ligase RNF169-like n=1 Tax=Thalassophryne amazonica TaxID=390379 RepID=UPI001470B4E5|nr:E3 ubiquitin-protein ligase RNF169-like [Thalassophryne amazonica]